MSRLEGTNERPAPVGGSCLVFRGGTPRMSSIYYSSRFSVNYSVYAIYGYILESSFPFALPLCQFRSLSFCGVLKVLHTGTALLASYLFYLFSSIEATSSLNSANPVTAAPSSVTSVCARNAPYPLAPSAKVMAVAQRKIPSTWLLAPDRDQPLDDPEYVDGLGARP